MCAICGIVNFDRRPISEAELLTMRDVMVNRGPEYGGQRFGGHAAFGHRQHRILDPSPLGDQPMANRDATVWVAFDGALYNAPELRKTLEAEGHRFRSRSEAEAIVHGYEEWGEGVVARLDGMFAIGLWDTRRERLLLAVDRLGKKPLYYAHRGATVRFASDSKAFWSLPGARLTVSPEAIDCYLHHLGVTIEHSIFEEVSRLPPAHYRVVTRDGSRIVRYWRPDFRHKIRVSEAEALERVDVQLKEAVRKRLVADVPLGIFLSGGVDSSLLVALLRQLSGAPLKTFSVGFGEQDASELEYASATAARYQTEHHEIRLEPDVLEVLPSLVWEYGEPFADASTIPTYYASKAAKELVAVALTGDGADGLFGGQDVARASFYSVHYDRLMPHVLRRPLEEWLFAAERTGYPHKLETLATHAHSDPARRHGYSAAFNQRQRDALYTDSFRASLDAHRPWHIFERHRDDVAGLNILDQNLYYGLAVRLPTDYLVKLDVVSMKVALELRHPFFDDDLCALSCSLDPELKVRRGRPKYLLKKLAERYLPRDVVYRRKLGFSLPLDRWLRADLAPLLDALLPDGNVVRAGWFRREEVRRLIAEHTDGSAQHADRLWSLLWLELWHRIFVERSMTGSESLRP